MIYLLAAMCLFVIGGFFWGYYAEKKDFNNGVCPNCGTTLRHFDNDSQGGQGWVCDKCGYVAWISWFKR